MSLVDNAGQKSPQDSNSPLELNTTATPTSTKSSSTPLSHPIASKPAPIKDDPEKRYVRETSASEIVKVMKKYSFYEQDEKFASLFEGKWIREPGWRGEVQSEATQNEFGPWEWHIGIVAPDEKTLFAAFTNQDLSDFRKGDTVQVVGELKGYLGSTPSVHEAKVTLAPGNE